MKARLEFPTLLGVGWFTHTARIFYPTIADVDAETVPGIFRCETLHLSRANSGDLRGPRSEAVSGKGCRRTPFTVTLGSDPRTRETKGGSGGSRKPQLPFPHKPSPPSAGNSGIRRPAEMHWHQTTDEGQSGQMDQGQRANDGLQHWPERSHYGLQRRRVGDVKKNLGHTSRTRGDTDLQFLEVFRSPISQMFPVRLGFRARAAAMVAQHLNVKRGYNRKIPKNRRKSCRSDRIERLVVPYEFAFAKYLPPGGKVPAAGTSQEPNDPVFQSAEE